MTDRQEAAVAPQPAPLCVSMEGVQIPELWQDLDRLNNEGQYLKNTVYRILTFALREETWPGLEGCAEHLLMKKFQDLTLFFLVADPDTLAQSALDFLKLPPPSLCIRSLACAWHTGVKVPPVPSSPMPLEGISYDKKLLASVTHNIWGSC